MALTDAGAIFLAQAARGASVTAFNAANAYLGVGSGNTAFSAAQTDLVGTSKTRKGMDVGYPSGASNVLTYQATFGTGDGNHDWLEWGLFNASAGGTMLGRLVANNGTKTNTQSWTFQITATFSAT
jgi:hypothetical protein